MFISEITAGLGQGFKEQARGEMDREKINQLKEIGNMRRAQFNQQMSQGSLQNEQLMMQVKELQNQLAERDKKKVQEFSYDSITNWMNSGKDDGTMDDRYLEAAYVEDEFLNKSMSQRLGMKQITGVSTDDQGNIIFKDSTSGTEKQVPMATFLPSIGYFKQQDKVTRENAEAKFQQLNEQWNLRKTMAETAKMEQEALGQMKPIDQVRLAKANTDLQISQAKLEEELSKKADKEAGAKAAMSQAEGAVDLVNKLLEHPGMEMGTGFTSILNIVPGTDMYDFEAGIETLKGKVFLSQIDQMKGMGALSNAEGDALRQSVANLSTGQTIDSVKENLQVIKDMMDTAKERMQNGIKAPKGKQDTSKTNTKVIEIDGKQVPVNIPIKTKLGGWAIVDEQGNIKPYEGK